MDDALLKPEIQYFINEHLFTDVQQLALKKNPFPEVDYKTILNQIVSKAKAKDKLQTWFVTDGILYPEKVSIEQTSSEIAAQFKSEIVSGESLLDASGGFGVDDYYFSKRIKEVFHCEINVELSAVVKHNFKKLGVSNISCFAGDSLEFLKNTQQHFDWIYVDPSRRNAAKGKVFLLADCLPNVPELLDYYFEKANHILIKAAPLLDISSAIQELKFVKNIYIVSIENEVKELLFELQKNYESEIAVKAVDFGKKATEFEALLTEKPVDLRFDLPQKYLYEPNSALMKTGHFDLISSRFKVAKLHPNSHLYTSAALLYFPGRIFEIQSCFSYNKENLKQKLFNQKLNVTARNFPETVENIRKKWKIKDGGNVYGFFTTDLNNQKIVLLCKKIQ